MGFWDALSPSDWFQFAGVVVAALAGVGVAVWGQASAHRAEQRERLNSALAEVIAALGRHAVALDAWAAPAEVPVSGSLGMRFSRPGRSEEIGGPLDAGLLTSVEAARLVARRREDRRCVQVLSEATAQLKQGSVAWQIQQIVSIAAEIRKWRTGDTSPSKFRDALRAHGEQQQRLPEGHER